jgi:hypothetical protein
MTELVCAWDLAAGDLLPGGETVTWVGRDEAIGRVWVTDDAGSEQSLLARTRLVVLRRGLYAERALSPRERFRARQRLDHAADRRSPSSVSHSEVKG